MDTYNPLIVIGYPMTSVSTYFPISVELLLLGRKKDEKGT